MDEFAEQIVDQEMFSQNDEYSYKSKNKYEKTKHYNLTPAEKK